MTPLVFTVTIDDPTSGMEVPIDTAASGLSIFSLAIHEEPMLWMRLVSHEVNGPVHIEWTSRPTQITYHFRFTPTS